MVSDSRVEGIFPSPVYITRRDSKPDLTEEKEIRDIIEDGMHRNQENSTSNNSYIFNTRLYNLKEFCERHIKIYVNEIINPKEQLDFYITQSWLNVTKPDEHHHKHNHQNSLISGVFYISSVEDDKIMFYDPNVKLKERIRISPKEYNIWNSASWFFSVEKNNLMLFPSWMGHGVNQNKNATTDRISISFNVFAKGIFGNSDNKNELIL